MDNSSPNNLLVTEIIKMQLHGLKAVYIVGSAATAEETNELHSENALSDIDVILDVSSFVYPIFRLLNYCDQISKILSSRLSMLSCKRKVSVGLTCLSLSKWVPQIAPNSIFLFEMFPVYGASKLPARQKSIAKSDAFDLAISSIIDYLSVSYQPSLVKTKQDCYVLAKRSLTLLNSLMLFRGLSSRSYLSRIAMANLHFNKLSMVVTKEDLSAFRELTNFKLSGDTSSLFKSFDLPQEDYEHLFIYLKSFFEKSALNILIAELTEMVQDNKSLIFSLDNFERLVKKYIVINRRSLFQTSLSFVSVARIILEFNSQKLIVALHSIFSNRIPVKVLIQCLVLLSFLDSAGNLHGFERKRIIESKLLWDSFRK